MAATKICVADGCNKPSRYGSVYCSMHEARVRRHGSPYIGAMKERGICSIEGCDRPHYGRGWCQKHYTQWRLTGSPIPQAPRTTSVGEPMEWIRSHANYAGDGCLTWPYATNGQGYADIAGPKSACRIMCEIVNGPSSSDRNHVAHNCGRGANGCINPRHLRWATRIENEADKIVHGTSNRGPRNGQAKLTEADIRSIRKMLGTKTHLEIASAFGVRRQLIGKIASGQRWGWLS